MAAVLSKVKHPHVTRRRGLAGNAPVVAGTKFPVRSVVKYVLEQGVTPEELVREFPQLTLPKIYDAISYYYDHQEAVDREIAVNTEAYWRNRV